MAQKPLRNWKIESYDDRGFQASGYGDKPAMANQMPSKLPKGDDYDASGSGDPGRRNK